MTSHTETVIIKLEKPFLRPLKAAHRLYPRLIRRSSSRASPASA